MRKISNLEKSGGGPERGLLRFSRLLQPDDFGLEQRNALLDLMDRQIIRDSGRSHALWLCAEARQKIPSSSCIMNLF